MAIKPHELRLGNWVKWTDEKEPNETPWHHGHWLGVHEKNYGYPDPIPLTIDWLFKFGFNVKMGTPAQSKAIYCDFEHRTKDFRIYLSDFPKHNSIHFDAANEWYPELTEFEFVHQLQNICFTLTGKELEVVSGWEKRFKMFLSRNKLETHTL